MSVRVPQVAVLRDLCRLSAKTQVCEYTDLWHPFRSCARRKWCTGRRTHPMTTTIEPETTTRPASSTDADIDALGPWFHNLHLPDGRQTCPGHPFGDFP